MEVIGFLSIKGQKKFEEEENLNLIEFEYQAIGLKKHFGKI